MTTTRQQDYKAKTRPTPTDALKIYFEEIGDSELLSAEEEIELANWIADPGHESLQFDRDAREQLVVANLRLVIGIAKNFQGRGVSLEDLIGEGNLGLMRAAESYDGKREIRFSTYAAFWIKALIKRLIINMGRPIKIPHYLPSLVAKWHLRSSELATQLGRPAESAEIGKSMGLSRKKIGIVVQAIHVNGLETYSEDNRHQGHEVGDWLSVTLRDDHARTPDEVMNDADEFELMVERLSELAPRERTVIQMRFGLDPYPEMSLAQVGEHFGVSREGVRRIQKSAMARLSRSPVTD